MGLAKAIRRALTSSGLLSSEKKFDADDELMLAALHPDAHDEGGLACNDEKLLKEMRECIMQWIKSMGRQLLQGNLNLVNTSFPVLMFEPRSYLQKLADIWAYPDFINAAAQQEPLERMKLLVTWMVAGLHHSVENWKKPFNPIIGETWQANMPGGLHLYMEQVSHHPPVSAYQLEGPYWSLSGWSQPAVVPVVKFYGIKTVAKGARHITFADGSVVQMIMPHFAIKGVVYASKPHAEVLGVARLLDEKNRLEAVVNFGPVPGTRQRMLARADAVCGEIYQLPRAAHLQEAAAGGGAIQRSGTCATALSELNKETYQLAAMSLNDASSTEGSHSDAAADVADPDDEAILAEFNATHFGSNSSSAKASAAAAASSATAASSGNAAASRYQRSKSTTFQDASSADGSSGSRAAVGVAGVPGLAVARIEGCWLSHLNVDNKRFWTLSECSPERWQVLEDPLPSDLRYREDLASLAAGDLAAAQHWKEVLEQQQRADRKARETAGVFEHH